MKRRIRAILLLVLLWCTGIVLWNLSASNEFRTDSNVHCNNDMGLFFVHIQKTGGTTLRSILVDKFIRKNFTSAHSCKAGWEIHRCDHDNLTYDCPGPKQLFSNHLAPSKQSYLQP